MNEEKPDLASGSLAYMPQGSKTSEAAPKADTIKLKVNKGEESASTAALADELADAKPAPEMKDHKVAVKSTPRDEEAAEALDTNSEPVSHAPGPIDLESTSRHDPSPVTPHNKKGSLGLLIPLLIFVIASLVLGWLWWSTKGQVTTLNGKVSDLESSNAALTKSLAEAKSTDVPAAVATPSTSSTRSLPEVALRFKLTDTTKRMTYAYGESADSAGTVHSSIYFSTTTLVGAERKVVTNNVFKCTAGDAPLGGLTSYKATDTVPSSVGTGKFSALKVDNAKTFKFGETYYVYVASQATCSTDKTVQASQTAEKAVITELLSSLEQDK